MESINNIVKLGYYIYTISGVLILSQPWSAVCAQDIPDMNVTNVNGINVMATEDFNFTDVNLTINVPLRDFDAADVNVTTNVPLPNSTNVSAPEFAAPTSDTPPTGTSRFFQQHPAEGTFLLEGEVGGKSNVSVTYPWQNYHGDAVHLFGYVNYEELTNMMSDADYVPFKTKIDGTGPDLGLMELTIVKYYNTSTGPYNEIVMATPVSKDGRPHFVEGCDENDVTCLFRETFTYTNFAWYVLRMYLSSELPVATGKQMFGINKFFTTVDIDIDGPADNKQWTFFMEHNIDGAMASDTGYVSDESLVTAVQKEERADKPNDTSVNVNNASKVTASGASMPFTVIEGSIKEPRTEIGDYVRQAMYYVGNALASGNFGKANYPADVIDMVFGMFEPQLAGENSLLTMIQPKNIWPQIFGDKHSVVSAVSTQEDLHVLYLEDCDPQLTIKGELEPLSFRPITCLFQNGLEGVIARTRNNDSQEVWERFSTNLARNNATEYEDESGPE